MNRHGIILALTLLAATPAVAGPPWISIELPVNPFSDARGAFLVVRTYHHGTPVQLVMQGTAEGLVNGARRSVPLGFTAMSQFGAFAVSRSWPSEGVWVLDIQSFDGHFAISAVVGIGASGEVSLVRVPLARTGSPRTVSRGEIDAMLRALAAGQQPPALQNAGLDTVSRHTLTRLAAIGGAGIGAVALLGALVRRLIKGPRTA
jgi:hypothetical protein